MPKRSGLMNEREKAICSRVREVRQEKERWSQVDFAARLGVSLHVVAGIEYERVPLKSDVGIRLCEVFNVSQQWLAEGVSERQPFVVLPDSVTRNIPSGLLFSEVYDRWLKVEVKGFDLYRSLLADLGIKAGQLPEVAETNLARRSFWIARPEQLPCMRKAAANLKSLCEVLKAKAAELEDWITNSQEHHRSHPNEVPETIQIPVYGEGGFAEEIMLTKSSTSRILPDVKSVMLGLRKRLEKVTKARGKKSELARFLGAPLASVSRWLSGLQQPGGETTLRLLEWVKLQEREQQGPDSGQTPSEPKTRERRTK